MKNESAKADNPHTFKMDLVGDDGAKGCGAVTLHVDDPKDFPKKMRELASLMLKAAEAYEQGKVPVGALYEVKSDG